MKVMNLFLLRKHLNITPALVFLLISSPLTINSQSLEEIDKPVFVGRPPHDAVNGLVQLPNGELRHYGQEGHRLNPHSYVYFSSFDTGFNWKRNLIPDTGLYKTKPPGYNPYSDDFIGFIRTSEGAFVVKSKDIDGPYKKIPVEDYVSGLRQPFFLKSKQRILLIGSGRSPEYEGTTVMQTAVRYSDDNGYTWNISYVPIGPRFRVEWPHKKSRWQNYAIEPTIAELENGTIWMLLRTSMDKLYESFSTDHGTTWSEPLPSRFYSTLTMPTFFRLKDGRLLLFFNSTTPLPEEDRTDDITIREEQKTGETWEDVFTNRDVLHAAISDNDGKTWTGFRELYLNPLRNEGDFATLGGTDVGQDKSIHQSQAAELPYGKVLLALGQHPMVRAFIIFDPDWLYDTELHDNFSEGLKDWTTFKYFKEIKGHCAYDRHLGSRMENHPDIENRKVLRIMHLANPELVCSVDGAIWNFPAAVKGFFTTRIMLKPGGKGGRISLLDRWFNPTDTLAYRYAMYSIKIDGEGMIGEESVMQPGKWVDLRFEWDDLTYGSCNLHVNGETYSLPLKYQSRNGINYVQFQSVAHEVDKEGYLIESVEAHVKSNREKDAK